jgi:hypothetical protein
LFLQHLLFCHDPQTSSQKIDDEHMSASECLLHFLLGFDDHEMDFGTCTHAIGTKFSGRDSDSSWTRWAEKLNWVKERNADNFVDYNHMICILFLFLSVLQGFCSGVLVLLVSKGQNSHILQFDEELFFIYLLPPIIFNAG